MTATALDPPALDAYSPPDADACRPFLAKIAASHLAELLAPCATCKGAKRVDAEHAGGHPVCRTCHDDTDLDGVCRATKPCPDCDKPRRHDDGPRLVFADWLDERGDPWGEAIRAGCRFAFLRSKEGGAHANHTEASKNCSLCHEVETLEARHDELLARHGAAWARVVLKGVWPGDFHSCESKQGWIGFVRHGVTFHWHGGLPADFTLSSLDAWRGERCGSCNGENIWINKRDRMRNCKTCSATGRVNALGPLLLAAAPVRVEGLRFADISPSGEDPFTWWTGHNTRSDLPRELFDRLEGGHLDETRLDNRRFPTAAAAHAALARAVIAEAGAGAKP